MGIFKAWKSAPPGAAAPAPASASLAIEPVLLLFATETGVAEDLAYDTEAQLQQLGVPVTVLPMDELELPRLAATARALFITSTTGQGDPPDMAWAFADECMQEPADLAHLACAVMALGDTSYPDFCQFGRDLHAWLLASGARELFPLVKVDDEEDEALQAWKDHIAALARDLAEVAPA